MKNSPLKAPYPVAEFMELSIEETLSCALTTNADFFDEGDTSSPAPCDTTLRVTLFFDGTNNNERRDRPHRSHSNIVKLFDVHKDDKALEGVFKIYVPGVGTRFPEIGELREEPMGKAAGKGGQARILFGLLQVYNAVHRAVYGDDRPMLDGDAIKALLLRYVREVTYGERVDGSAPPLVSRAEWFDALGRELRDKLHKAIRWKRQPRIRQLVISVFGFSRGAVQARAFCHWFADAAAGGYFAGIPAAIRFVGLFDSVASVGLADSARLTTPLWFADGHFDWAAEVRKPLPSMVGKVVHYVAGHEQRMNFPLTLVRGGEELEEVIFPGVHSDVGGGYGPGAQGRSPQPADLLSQIPLLHMYKAALLAGVPMQAFSEIQKRPEIAANFQVSQRLAEAWDSYMRLVGFNADGQHVAEGDYGALVRLHMGPYYRLRGLQLRLRSFEQEAAFQAASAQEQEDLSSYNQLLLGDVRMAVLRRKQDASGKPSGWDPTFGEVGNQFPKLLLRGWLPLSEWEQWALKCADEPRFEANQGELLAAYVHDSLAGFYLAYPTTCADKAALIRQVQAKQAEGKALNPVEARIAAAMAREPELAQEVREGSDTEDLPPASRNRLDAVFPVLSDADARYLRQTAILTQTATAREGGGYLRARKVF
ncbi:DUF2235 domain-containing protein [Variovorax sp. J2P1-59]|uniref:T6SS phospholipase effector Tle1-like catalytic domain-containing protein n=1 Tax=Variovorax flavidus TaxID=3053501 RepID=UPI002575B998|nr:DUF2235 domain-containing protein [Variovorax sp. J2P1-59]MDM0075020.1 DUF2235 domain-containing protein [Variovorax sp. J2P1-59]